MSCVDIPSIQTDFAPYSTSSSSPINTSHPYRSTSPGSPVPSMTSSQSRSYSISSASSHLSTYSSSSDRSLSTSPGPATPCEMKSRSPSFSHDSIYKPTLPSLPHKHPHFPSFLSSPSPSPQRYNSLSPSSSRHHPYQTLHHHQQKQYHQDRFYPSSSYRTLSSPSSPREMYSNHSSHTHGDYSYHYQSRSPFTTNQADYFQSRSSMYHNTYPMMVTPKIEESESSCLRSTTPPPVSRSSLDLCAPSSPIDDGRSDYSPSMSHSPSLSNAGSSFSRESSPEDFGSMSEASASVTSLVSSASSNCSSNSPSMTPVPTTTQLLLCPVCSRAFKPSKNQNCNLRRHLKNVHNMSPTIHPRKCKWDSLPDGRVKDDKDRKERTRKSKRLWARKFRLRRKVEEAAVVLSMLSQAV